MPNGLPPEDGPAAAGGGAGGGGFQREVSVGREAEIDSEKEGIKEREMEATVSGGG